MSQNSSNSLINLGNLSKPADTLIKKVSDAVGGLFAPYQVKRMAKAEAEAAMIKAQSKTEITDLHRRAVHRWIEEEAQRQKNMEDITAKALPQLDEKATPDSVEDDWLVNFFDKSRIVSDNEMQELWSRVLAGEANTPGTYSKRTVNFLSDLDKADAELFAKLCGFGWMIGYVVPLVFDVQAEIYNKHGINFNSLSHLESIGLVQFDSVASLVQRNLPKKFTVHYYGKLLKLEMPKDSDNELGIGKVLLTKIGQELAPICGSESVEGFREYVMNQWKQYLPKSETV
ncbi:MAG: DUF2806 domain-containing protein [Nitrospinae bacterium]|nr:DUF2806 domain-containing protein [Nitrospinota bacterium]